MADPPKSRPPSAATPPPRLERHPPGGTPARGTAAPATTPAASRGLSARVVTADAAIAAGLEQEGRLASESGLRLFALCASTQASGRLTLAAAAEAYLLTFRKGNLEHVASTSPDDDLARHLLDRGAVTPDQFTQAEAAKAGSGGDVVAALITLRIVNPGDLVRWLQEHWTALAIRALGLEDGGWRWEPGLAPPPGAFPLGSPWSLLGAAVRALDAAAVVRRLGAREELGATRVGGRIRPEDLRLTAQESRAASLLDGQRLSDVARAYPGEATTILRVALLLAEAELLAFGPPREGVAPPRPAVPASPPPAARAPAIAPAPPPVPPGEPAAARPPPPAAKAPPRAPPASASAPRPAAPRPAQAPTPAPALAPQLQPAALQAMVARFHAKETDFFQILGVPREATGAQIKVAYFQLAKAYHPDTVPIGTPPEIKQLCADLFGRIGEAWGVLGEDASRHEYLEGLKTGAGVDVDVMNILHAENVFQEATLLVKARRYDEAVPRLLEAIKLNPDEAEFGMWKAWCDFLLAAEKKKAYPGAAGAIEGGLKKNPNCAQGYLFLGQMAKLMGELDQAEKQLKRGLGVAPEHSELQRELKYLRK